MIDREVLPRIDWDAQPLGNRSDEEIAQTLRCTRTAVCAARKRRGISRFGRIDWDNQPLGKKSDVIIARELGVSPPAVAYARNARGIGPFGPAKAERTKGIDWSKIPVGEAPDAEISERFGLREGTVQRERLRRGIKFKDPKRWLNIDWEAVGIRTKTKRQIHQETGIPEKLISAAKRDLVTLTRYIDWDKQPLGKELDTEIAKRLGCHRTAVKVARDARGIPAKKFTRWENVPFGKKSDMEIAREMGVSNGAVGLRRKALGIPVFKP